MVLLLCQVSQAWLPVTANHNSPEVLQARFRASMELGSWHGAAGEHPTAAVDQDEEENQGSLPSWAQPMPE